MKREVVFTKDGDCFMSLDPPGAHIYTKDKLAICVDLEQQKGECLEDFTDKCIAEATKRIIRRYFSLRSYME